MTEKDGETQNSFILSQRMRPTGYDSGKTAVVKRPSLFSIIIDGIKIPFLYSFLISRENTASKRGKAVTEPIYKMQKSEKMPQKPQDRLLTKASAYVIMNYL